MSAIRERQNEIYDVIKNNGEMKVVDLAEMFHVSGPTLRKDLNQLESAGLIRRAHGVALIREDYTTVQMPAFRTRTESNAELKQRIAREAVQHIKDGDTIILDAGTTTLEIAKLLVPRLSLTIFTPSLSVAMEFRSSRVVINLIGGIYVSENLSVHGPDTEAYLKRIHADKAFLSPSGVRPDYGLCNQDALEASMQRCMVSAADEVYAVFDSTKLHRNSAYPFASFRDLNYLITDEDITDPVTRQSVNASGAQLIIAE